MTEKDHEKLKEELSPEEYYVTQNKGPHFLEHCFFLVRGPGRPQPHDS